MKSTQEKKFFLPTLKHYQFDLSKRWRVEYYIPTHNGKNSRRVVIYGEINSGTSVEERIKISELLINSIDQTRDKKKSSILDQVIEAYSIAWRPKTISAYKTVIESLKRFAGKKNLDSVTEEIINKYLSYLVVSGTSKNTVIKYRNTLFTLFQKAIEQKLTTTNPVKNIALGNRSPQSLMYFNDLQIKLIKEAVKGSQLELCIKFLYYCFIRPGELRLLRIGDINFDFAFIEIRAEISKNKKTQKVQIPSQFLQEIQFLKQYSNSSFVIGKLGTTGAIPVGSKWINSNHSKVLDKLKIRGRYAFYSWKHTGVVKAVKSGINIKDLQLQLRHHSLDMVNEYLKNLGVMDSEDIRDRFPSL